MMKTQIAASALLLTLAGAATAGTLSVTPTLATDYDFRGISQTDPEQDGDVAVQLGATYAFDNGFYLGAWGSNVDFGLDKPDLELDFYAGFAGSNDTFGYDIGALYYKYPSASDLDFFEGYAGVTMGPLGAKLWFSPEFGGESDESAFYAEANLNHPLGMMEGLSVLGHVGYSFGNYWDRYSEDYFDYSAGLGYSFKKFNVAVKWVDNNNDALPNRNAVIASVSTTFPWTDK